MSYVDGKCGRGGFIYFSILDAYCSSLLTREGNTAERLKKFLIASDWLKYASYNPNTSHHTVELPPCFLCQNFLTLFLLLFLIFEKKKNWGQR